MTTTPEMTEQQKKCVECRECCEYVEFPVTMLSVDVMDYFIFRGNQFYVDKGGALMIRVKNPCKYLTEAGCSIYGDDRPLICRTYLCEVKDKSVREIKKRQCEAAMKIAVKGLEEARAKIAALEKQEG